jgi:soluble lytic murein transglycosylase-like protein
MQRRLTTTLFCTGLFALSCEFASTPALPPVSAAAPPAEAPTEELRADDAIVDALVLRFASRPKLGLTPAEIEAVARAIAQASRRYDIEPGLVLAVIHVESRYDTYAVSPVGALGLMQILPSTGRELAERTGIPWRGPRTLFDPVANVALGVAYLRQLSDRYGSTRAALAAYNWGPGHIDRRLRLGTPMPTVYPGLVLQAYAAHREDRS